MRHYLLTFAVALLVLAPPSQAITLSTYQSLRREPSEALNLHVQAISDGMLLANALLQVRHEKLLFCLPPKLAINAANVIQLVDDEVSLSKDYKPDTDVGVILITAYVRTFPCHSQ